MRISQFVIVILIMGGIFAGFYSFANSLGEISPDTYNMTLDDSYQNEFVSGMNDVSVTSGEMIQTIQGIESNSTGVVGWIVDKTAFLALVPQALSLILDILVLPINLLSTFVTAMAEGLGLSTDGWIFGFIVSLITVSIIFAFISLIMKTRS